MEIADVYKNLCKVVGVAHIGSRNVVHKQDIVHELEILIRERVRKMNEYKDSLAQ